MADIRQNPVTMTDGKINFGLRCEDFQLLRLMRVIKEVLLTSLMPLMSKMSITISGTTTITFRMLVLVSVK